jgi:branched-chain amino acid transport system permease protein
MLPGLNYLLDALVYIGIFGILAISLNLEAGFTRLMNFGVAAFFAIGAYTTALLTINGVPIAAGFFAAILLSGLAGFLVALPTLRLREDYFAIVTIALGEILRNFLTSEDWLTKGTRGLPGIPRPLFSLFYENYLIFYTFLVYLFLLICYLFTERIVRSPFGRVLKAIREDEKATQSLGKDTFRFKIICFVIGSSMAGIAGVLFAHYFTFIAPDMFAPTLTFSVWTMVVVGGSANNIGVIFGALLVQLFERTTRFLKDLVVIPVDPNNIRLIIIGLLLILFVMYKPRGILEEEKPGTTRS